MILHPITLSEGPGIVNIIIGALIWMCGMLLIMFHRSGIQLLGLIIIGIGFFLLLFLSQPILAAGLMFIGFVMHGFGRILIHLKKRG